MLYFCCLVSPTWSSAQASASPTFAMMSCSGSLLLLSMKTWSWWRTTTWQGPGCSQGSPSICMCTSSLVSSCTSLPCPSRIPLDTPTMHSPIWMMFAKPSTSIILSWKLYGRYYMLCCTLKIV
eukprot:CAMPEP_0201286066 /NCGR_PEP_ID=MMETSP1317-20130820/114220_1 /ASSEMBLY_ACC=CAM_ASM_000770 /TAXON_ID=187299 /ORGANISM="Undescribed Undescribed, Strain Undescribed" /LENGTH=122 /DNA_ID=CAMNT_0047612531 /DNA_START=448 /DNA_END=812 /DNA_ORIENTATION=-